jgi:hypothetical protein
LKFSLFSRLDWLKVMDRGESNPLGGPNAIFGNETVLSRLTDFSVSKIHDGKAVKLPTLAHNAEVEHHPIKLTVRWGVSA